MHLIEWIWLHQTEPVSSCMYERGERDRERGYHSNILHTCNVASHLDFANSKTPVGRRLLRNTFAACLEICLLFRADKVFLRSFRRSLLVELDILPNILLHALAKASKWTVDSVAAARSVSFPISW